MQAISSRTAAPQASWTYNTTEDHEALVSQPQDGVAVVASGTYAWNGLDKLQGLDAQSGQPRWTIEHAFAQGLAPTLGADGSLYSQSYDGNSLWVRDVKDGHLSRSVPVPFTMYSAVSEGQSGNVYVGGATEKDHSIYALDKTTGAIKWQYATHYLTSMTPVEVNGTVYYGEGERLFALDPASGKMKWSFSSDDGITQPPVVGPDGKLYVIDTKDTVYAIDPSQGKPDGSTPALWKSKLDVPIQNPDQEANFDSSQPLILTADGLTAIANGQTIRQLDTANGQKKWEIQAPIDGVAWAGPNGIYIGDGEGVLHVDPKTGQGTRWDAGDGVAPKDSTASSTVVQYGLGKVAGF